MPETMIFEPEDTRGVGRFIERKGKVILKRGWEEEEGI